ncbi:MAG: hypothetical protein AAF557_22770 [Pseudomonadota bacterium]
MRRLLVLSLIASLASYVHAAEVVGYGEVDGQNVELLSDGTWQLVRAAETEAGDCPKGVLAESSLLPVALCFKQAIWREAPKADAFEQRYVTKSGELWAGVITERIPIGPALIRDAILANAQRDGTKARNVTDLDPVVLGPELRLDALSYIMDVKDTEFWATVYYGPIHGEGTLQIMFWTVSALAEDASVHIPPVVKSLRIIR